MEVRCNWRGSVDTTDPIVLEIIKNVTERTGFNIRRMFINCFDLSDDTDIHIDSYKGADENSLTGVLYLNKFWNPSWGAHTIVMNDEGMYTGIIPEEGKLVVFPSLTEHANSAVARLVPYPRMSMTINLVK